MGACASKFKEFKDIAGDGAAPPLPKEEAEASREVKLVEETVSKDDVPTPPPPAAEGEAKSRSLGLLFKENEGENGSADSNNGKSLEEVKQEVDATEATPQENRNVKSPEPVADAPAKGETEKAPATEGLKSTNPEENEAENVKSANENVVVEASPKKTEQKFAETTKTETSEKCEGSKPDETLDTERTEEPKPVSDEEKKKTEEKPTENTKLETEWEKFEKTEEAPAEIPKIETEDKQVVEPTKVESSPENKSVTDKEPETPETKAEEQKQVSDGEKAKAGEEETKK